MKTIITSIRADLYDKTADVTFSYVTAIIDGLGSETAEFELRFNLEAASKYHVGQEVEITFKF